MPLSTPLPIRSLCLLACVVLAACATSTGAPQAAAGPGSGAAAGGVRSPLAHSSPECVAKNLKPGDPFPVSAIPADALSRRENGWVAMRYDVVAGKATNISVIESRPSGLYDDAALQHAARYRDPGGNTVRGCVMTIDVKF